MVALHVGPDHCREYTGHIYYHNLQPDPARQPGTVQRPLIEPILRRNSQLYGASMPNLCYGASRRIPAVRNATVPYTARSGGQSWRSLSPVLQDFLAYCCSSSAGLLFVCQIRLVFQFSTA